MLRQQRVNGVVVIFQTQPVDGRGWTWSYVPSGPRAAEMGGAQHAGALFRTEPQAFKAATEAAERDASLRSSAHACAT